MKKHRTSIKETELRGITLSQLEDLVAHIDRHADAQGFLSSSKGEPWLDWQGQRLHKDAINLYEVKDYVIKPATAKRKCRFVELHADDPEVGRRAKVFISHTWRASFKDLVAMIAHALPDDAVVWVDIFAVLQWNPDDDDLSVLVHSTVNALKNQIACSGVASRV